MNSLNDTVEIIEDNDKLEKIDYKYKNTYGNISQHRKSEEPLIDTINKIIDHINKIEEKLDEK